MPGRLYAISAPLLLAAIWGQSDALSFLAMLRLWYWPSLAAALLIEAAALVWLLGWDWRRAARAAALVNAIGLLAGFVLYPVAGAVLMWPVQAATAAAGPAAMPVLVGLVALGYAAVDTAVEYPVLRLLFGLARSGRALAVVFAANLASAGALVGLVILGDLPAGISDREVATLERTYAREIALMRDILDDLNAAPAAPWTDPGWLERRQREAQEMQFQWLEVRRSPGERRALVPMRDSVHAFDGRREEPGRLILRGDRDGYRLYRLLLGGGDEAEGAPEVAADFRLPP